MVLYSIGREYIDERVWNAYLHTRQKYTFQKSNKMIFIMNFIYFNNEINQF